MKKVTIFILLAFYISVFKLNAQTSTTGANYISTAVPFLTITPDSRSGAMGDVGVALSPDINSQHWNPAKYAFMQSKMGFSVSYTPWLRDIVNDINLGYLVGYKKLDDMQTISASLRFFTLGNIVFTNDDGFEQGTRSPNEFAIDMGYSRKLSDHLSAGIVFRYIRSDLTSGQYVGGEPTHAGNAFAADLSVYYKKDISISQFDSQWSWGANISNLGSKISYVKGAEKDYIPTNLKLGTAIKTNFDNSSSFTFSVDLNKLLVPTPNASELQSPEGSVVVGGYGSDKSVVSGVFSSFSDAPGGFSEEIKEVMWSLGAEYWYQKQFALRAGYFYESAEKGNRKYFTAGLGLRYDKFIFDFSYLIPTTQNNPLQNTIRFSLGFDLNAFTKIAKK
jgi:hypothetical protein